MSSKDLFAPERLRIGAGLSLLFSLAGSVYAFDVIPTRLEDVVIYLTFCVLLLTFGLAFINFRNIRYEKKLMDEERTELIKQRLRLDDDLEKEKEEVAIQKKCLEKELVTVNKKWEEIKSKEILWEEQGRKIQEFRPEDLEETRKQIEMGRVYLDEDRKKLECDMQVIADQLKELEEIKRQRSEDMQKIEDDKKRIEAEWKELEKQKAFLGQNVGMVESQWDEMKGTGQKLEEYKIKIEEDQKRIEIERMRIQKEEKKIEEDRKKMDADLKEIESMWLDVENAMKRIEEERKRLR